MNKTILLKNLANYVEDKISADKLNKNNYIGVDNILPNRGGIKTSEYFYGKGKVTAFKKGDILIGNIRPYFKKIWLATFDGGCDTDVLCIRPKEEELSSFLYSTLSTDFFFNYVVKGAKGSKMPRGDKKHIMEFPIMDISNKKVIGDFIVAINEKIANNNAISKELESMAKTIYDYWFLQFEFPDKDGKPYKSNGGKMVWNDQLKQEIPEGWEVGTIEDLGEIISGGTPSTMKKDYYSKKGIAWLTPNDLSNSHNKYITHGERDITKEGLENSSARLMPKGTVLLTSRAPIGYLGIAINKVTTNQGFKSIVPKKTFGSEYIYYTLKNLIPYLKSVGTGSTFTEISKTVLKDVKIPIPAESVVSYFENIVSSLGTKHRINETENQQLQSLRDFLLPILMNGQVTIED